MTAHEEYYYLPTRKGARRNTFLFEQDRFHSVSLRDKEISTTGYLVLSCLIHQTDFGTGLCGYAKADIAEEIGRSVSTVERAIKSLKDAGWLEIEKTGESKSSFRVRLPSGRLRSVKGAQK